MALGHGHSYGDMTLSADANAHLGDIHHHHYTRDSPKKEVYDILYQSLTFKGMHSRLRNIGIALSQTCQWLKSHQLFLSWKDHNQASSHHGPLWLKGKPGSGKSTIMKDTLQWAREEWPDQLVLSYFFNARASSGMEKSCLGLYRSLTHQLLSVRGDLRPRFMTEFATKEHEGKVESWTEIELQNFLRSLLTEGFFPYLNIFVDALDESDYGDVWSLITFFERISEKALFVGSVFRLCLSSRHYPQITIERGLSLVLEDQLGHSHDIKLYIEKTLPSKSSTMMNEIRDSLFEKANGVFLWVVLTISLLKPFHARGRLKEMKRQLQVLPSDLYDLFSAIMDKSTEDMDECITLLQWMMVRRRVLSTHELCLAINFRDPLPHTDLVEDLGDFQDIAIAGSYVLDCSRGFVEPTDSAGREVQFIHESVRQFLASINQKKEHLQDMQPNSFDFSQETCNLVVAEGCLRYLLSLREKPPLTYTAFQDYPLARYAAKYWWRHLQLTSTSHNQEAISLAEVLLTGSENGLLRWAQMYNMDRDEVDLRLQLTAQKIPQPLYYAACIGLPALFTTKILHGGSINARWGCFHTPLGAALAYSHIEVAKILLDQGADVNSSGGEHGNVLHVAAAKGLVEVVHLLLDRGAYIDAKGGKHDTALQTALAHGREEVVQLLLDRGADVNAEGSENGYALQIVARNGHRELVQLLLDQGANVNAKGGHYGSAIQAAAGKGHTGIVQLLLDRGADVDNDGGRYGSALCIASSSGHIEVVQLLLNNGADVNAQGIFGTALHAAAYDGRTEIVQMLLTKGAIIGIRAAGFRNVLNAAYKGRHPDIIKLLEAEFYRRGHETSCLLKEREEIRWCYCNELNRLGRRKKRERRIE